MQKIIDFWAKGYHSDKTAFFYEIVSFIFTVGASLYLAVTADNPRMEFVYPGFFVGAVAGAYGYYRRGLAWPMLLTTYFTFVNIFGFGVAMLWW